MPSRSKRSTGSPVVAKPVVVTRKASDERVGPTGTGIALTTAVGDPAEDTPTGKIVEGYDLVPIRPGGEVSVFEGAARIAARCWPMAR
jgi:hypothetical protein